MKKLILGLTLTLPACSSLSIYGDVSEQIGGSLTYTIRQQVTHTPRGRVGVMVEVPVSPNFNFYSGLEHLSFLEGGDRGEERAYVGAKYYIIGGNR